MEMKKLIITLMAALAVLSCAPEDIAPEEEQLRPQEQEKESVRLSVAMTHPAHSFDPEKEDPMELCGFQEGATIHLTSIDQDPSVYELRNNEWAPQNGTGLKWLCDSITVTARYPASAGIVGYRLPLDQSSPEQLAAADVMSCTVTGKNENETLDLAMLRQTARIRIGIQFSSPMLFKKAKVTAVEISANKAPFSREGEAGTFKLNRKGDIYTAIVGKTDTAKISIEYEYNEGGVLKTARREMKSLELAMGTCRYISLFLDKDKTDILKNDVSEWEVNMKLPQAVETVIVIPETHTIETKDAGLITPEMIKEALDGGTELHLIGPLNGTDLKYIRDAAGCPYEVDQEPHAGILRKLDMKECTMVEGGLPYGVCRGGAFTYNSKQNEFPNWLFTGSSLTELIVPDSVTFLASNCFKNSKDFTSISYGDKITAFGNFCFMNCTALKKLVIKSNVLGLGVGVIDGSGITELIVEGDRTSDRYNFWVSGTFSKFTGSEDCDLKLNQTWASAVDFRPNGDKYFAERRWKSISVEKPSQELFGMCFHEGGILAGTTDLVLHKLTIEAQVMFSSFNACNTIIGKEHELLLRVGDENARPDPVDRHCLEIAAKGNRNFHVTAQNCKLTTLRWYHVAFTYDDLTGDAILYIDAQPVARATWPTGLSFNIGGDGTGNDGNGLMVGKIIGYQHGERPFDGVMKEVRVWSDVITADRMIMMMNGIDPNSSNLELYYKMDSESSYNGSDTMYDATGKRNGTISGDIRWSKYKLPIM